MLCGRWGVWAQVDSFIVCLERVWEGSRVGDSEGRVVCAQVGEVVGLIVGVWEGIGVVA